MAGGVTVKAGTIVLSGRLSPYFWNTTFPEHPLYYYPVSTPHLFLQLNLCFVNKLVNLVNSQQPLARALINSTEFLQGGSFYTEFKCGEKRANILEGNSVLADRPSLIGREKFDRCISARDVLKLSH